jgi:signal transduction histidine kinase
MERLLLDLETGQRGYVITKREEFLQPWQSAHKALPAEARRFTESATSPGQRRTAEQITRGVESFLSNYSVPLVQMVRRGDPAASSLEETGEGRQRVDALRAQFDKYMTDERAQLAERADAAEELAGGDLSVRITPSRVAEIGALGSSFNTMAASLQDSRRRIMESTEAVHRRTARDLHDGAQQRLVSPMIGLRLARELLPDTETAAIDLLDQSIDNAQTAINELRELASGIYPLVLTVKGLVAAVKNLASRCPVPTVVEGKDERRVSSTVESHAYFVVAEAVTNAVKHALRTQTKLRLTG